MRLTYNEATELFQEHTEIGESKVLVPGCNPENVARFEAMKSKVYKEFTTSNYKSTV